MSQVFDKFVRETMEVCIECAAGRGFKVVGLTGSWGKALCQICGKRQASLLIKSGIVDTERG